MSEVPYADGAVLSARDQQFATYRQYCYYLLEDQLIAAAAYN